MKEQGNLPHPMKGNPIKCPCCNHLIGYEKDFMFMVISEPGVVCPVCDEIVIWAIKPMYKEVFPDDSGNTFFDKLPQIESHLKFHSISLLRSTDGTSI